MVSALLVPVLLLLFGVVFPLGLLAPPDHAHLASVLGHPLIRIALLGLCVLSLLHWAHRFRYTLYDGLQLKRLSTPDQRRCATGWRSPAPCGPRSCCSAEVALAATVPACRR